MRARFAGRDALERQAEEFDGGAIARYAIDLDSLEARLVAIGDEPPHRSAYQAVYYRANPTLWEGRQCRSEPGQFPEACPSHLLAAGLDEAVVCDADTEADCAVADLALCEELGGRGADTVGFASLRCVGPPDVRLALAVADVVSTFSSPLVTAAERVGYLAQDEEDIREALRAEMWRIKGAVLEDMAEAEAICDAELAGISDPMEHVEAQLNSEACFSTLYRSEDFACGIESFLRTSEHTETGAVSLVPLKDQEDYDRPLTFFSAEQIEALRSRGDVMVDTDPPMTWRAYSDMWGERAEESCRAAAICAQDLWQLEADEAWGASLRSRQVMDVLGSRLCAEVDQEEGLVLGAVPSRIAFLDAVERHLAGRAPLAELVETRDHMLSEVSARQAGLGDTFLDLEDQPIEVDLGLLAHQVGRLDLTARGWPPERVAEWVARALAEPGR